MVVWCGGKGSLLGSGRKFDDTIAWGERQRTETVPNKFNNLNKEISRQNTENAIWLLAVYEKKSERREMIVMSHVRAECKR